jgi:hypothetical protein
LDYNIELKLACHVDSFVDEYFFGYYITLNLTIILILQHLQASTCQFCSLKSFKKLSKGGGGKSLKGGILGGGVKKGGLNYGLFKIFANGNEFVYLLLRKH